jgi:hypothetical protein
MLLSEASLFSIQTPSEPGLTLEVGIQIWWGLLESSQVKRDWLVLEEFCSGLLVIVGFNLAEED